MASRMLLGSVVGLRLDRPSGKDVHYQVQTANDTSQSMIACLMKGCRLICRCLKVNRHRSELACLLSTVSVREF